MRNHCTICQKQLSRGALKTCRPCIKAAKRTKPDKFCADCGIKINARQNKSGYCRKCLLACNRADPAAQEKRIHGLKVAAKRPETRERRRQAIIARTSNPAVREALREAGKRNYHLTVGSEKARLAAMTPEVRARRGRTHSERDMAWCPPEYRDDYRTLAKRIPAEESRRLILEQIATDKARLKASLSPFERQMEAIKNGAGISIKQPIGRKDYDFTLGGVADL